MDESTLPPPDHSVDGIGDPVRSKLLDEVIDNPLDEQLRRVVAPHSG